MGTVRRIIVMRHAKSCWKNGALSDHARPLNARGHRDAPKMARALSQRGWVPEKVISSNAQRTRETFSEFCKGLEHHQVPPVDFHGKLYLSGLMGVIEELSLLNDKYLTVMVLGHNPDWDDLVYELCGENIALLTATAALLTKQVPSWHGVLDGNWKLEDVLYPREVE